MLRCREGSPRRGEKGSEPVQRRAGRGLVAAGTEGHLECPVGLLDAERFPLAPRIQRFMTIFVFGFGFAYKGRHQSSVLFSISAKAYQRWLARKGGTWMEGVLSTHIYEEGWPAGMHASLGRCSWDYKAGIELCFRLRGLSAGGVRESTGCATTYERRTTSSLISLPAHRRRQLVSFATRVGFRLLPWPICAVALSAQASERVIEYFTGQGSGVVPQDRMPGTQQDVDLSL